MVRYSGLDARLGNLSTLAGPYNLELIGDVEDFEVLGQGETVNVPNLGNAYLTGLTMGKVRPQLKFNYHPQNTSYLHNYLIVQTGGTLSGHNMAYYANSADYGVIFNCKPSTVEVSFAKNSPVMVRTTLYGTNWSTGLQTSTGNFSNAVSSTEPMMSEQVTSVKIYDGATLIRNYTDLWRRGSFTIDYKTEQTFTGTDLTPSDVLEGVREIKGTLELSVNESTKLMSYVTNGSVLNLEIGFQCAPMSSCYCFLSSIIRANTVQVPGTDVQRQRLEWATRYVTRSSM